MFEKTGPLVVGSGVAGLSGALALEGATLITKSTLAGGGSTRWAQGGIAAAVGTDDAPRLHAEDTVMVSGGLADREAVEILTAGGPAAIDRLIALGARFDRAADGSLALGREAGHRRRRILHADGDATGAEVQRALAEAALTRPDLQIHEHTLAVDLVLMDGRVVGVLAVRPDGRRTIFLAPAVVLATGGIGRVYARTTNPAEVTGDGVAMAARAGATLADLEFVQFHPTALAGGADPMPLLTEALRGEGARLVDDTGDRFMVGAHPDAELAPRDVVARAIGERIAAGRTVFLDARMVGGEFPKRFPTVFAAAREVGLDPRRRPLPVSPAAHYYMGGILTDHRGRTSLPGLWAAGEVSSTGVHGANRLASNSLLEGLVFGARLAGDVRNTEPEGGSRKGLQLPDGGQAAVPGMPAEAAELREAMWRYAGLVRDDRGLGTLLAILDDLAPRLAGSIEARNLWQVARLVASAARRRTESRGGHYRADFPTPDERWAHRTIVHPEARLVGGYGVAA